MRVPVRGVVLAAAIGWALVVFAIIAAGYPVASWYWLLVLAVIVGAFLDYLRHWRP